MLNLLELLSVTRTFSHVLHVERVEQARLAQQLVILKVVHHHHGVESYGSTLKELSIGLRQLPQIKTFSIRLSQGALRVKLLVVCTRVHLNGLQSLVPASLEAITCNYGIHITKVHHNQISMTFPPSVDGQSLLQSNMREILLFVVLMWI